ncbi:protein of unknown function DUF4094 [Dillenia turbinata]|uniref:Hexosyltransferase n=1 Tax=Dillenia turbinata TaxID=194707 RepID=A0AAN8ZF46_9MAGN
MQSRSSNYRLYGSGSSSSFGSRVSFLMLSMFATMASLYVAGRLWQDAETRVYLIKELDRRTGQGQAAVSVDDTLKIIACREQQKKLSALEMELAAARQEGFVSKHLPESDETQSKKKLLAVIGVMTTFGRKNNRDAIRKAWMSTGAALNKLEEGKGIVIRFVIGKSANRGDSLDRDINSENALGATLTSHMDKPRAYIGCMKSGEVFSEPYFRHASGEIYAISRALAQSILRSYAHDDVSTGSWFIGLDVKHVDERRFCCSPWSTGNLGFAVPVSDGFKF